MQLRPSTSVSISSLALILLPLLKPAQAACEAASAGAARRSIRRRRFISTARPARPLSWRLGGAAREALRLADVLEQMLYGARDALAKADRRLIEETRNRDDVLDGLNTAIKRYLTSIDSDALNEDDQRRLTPDPRLLDEHRAGRRRHRPQPAAACQQASEARPDPDGESDADLTRSDGPTGRSICAPPRHCS